MMTKEEYYAQIKEMYAQKYESKDKKIEAADRRFREYLRRRNDDDDETDWWYRSEKKNPEDQVLNDEELVETEVETKASEIEDQAVENEANSKMISAIVKEESIPQFLMVTEADSTCVQHTNVILQQVSISPLEHSLNFCKANLDVMGNCQYAMGKTHQIWSDSNFGCVNDDACQVFDVIPMRTKVLPKEHKERFHKSWRFKFKHRVASRESKAGFEVNMKHNQSKEMLLQLLLSGTHKKRQRKTPKYHKTWKFKFKPTSKRSKLMDDMFSLVEETALLKKDPKETIWDCVKKEFKETMAAHGKTRVDRFKLVEEKASRPEVLNLNQTCLYHQIGHGVDILLAFKMLDPDKEMAVVLQRSTSLTIRDCPDRSSQANRVWKPGGIKEVSLICLGIHNMKLKEKVDICFWTHHNLRCLITHSVLETTKLHETSSLVSLQKNAEMTIPLAKETQDWIVNTWSKIQVFSDFDIASWIGLEICGCETKKHMLLLMKLANRVWDCGELLATQVYRKWLENCYKHKWRSRLSHSFSEMKQRMIVSVWKSFGCLMEEMMEEDQKLQGDSEPLLTVPDFAARFCETFDQYTREKGSVGAERESESNQPTLRFSTWVIEILPNHYMVLLLTPVAYAIHFLGGVGMAKKQSHLSLWINRVWDPGRSLVKDASYSIRIFSSLPATVPVSLLCQESFAYQITSFSTNLEVKVSLKGEDLLQVYWTWAGSRPIFSSDSP